MTGNWEEEVAGRFLQDWEEDNPKGNSKTLFGVPFPALPPVSTPAGGGGPAGVVLGDRQLGGGGCRSYSSGSGGGDPGETLNLKCP